MKPRLIRIGNVLHLQRRAVDVQPLATYEEIGVRSFGRGIFHKEPVSGAELGAKRVFEIHPGDLILSNVFAWEGAIALASEEERGKIGSHRFMTYVADRAIADESYLRYFFVSERGLELIRRASPGSAGRNRTLAIDRFEALEIPMPEIEEQRRIASKISSVASRAAIISGRVAAASKLSYALPASLAQRHDLGDIEKQQQGWSRCTLGEVMAEVSDMVTVEPTETYRNIGVLSFGRGLFEKPAIDGSITSAKKLNRVRVGQFMYSRLFAFEGAYTAIPERFNDYFVSGEFPTFDVDPQRLLAPYLAAYLKSEQTWAELAGSSKGLGVRRQRIHAESLLAYEVWLPPIEQQRRVISQLNHLEQAALLRERSSARVSALQASALNQMFAGFV